MKWFTTLRIVLATALVVFMAAPIALCAVNTQSSHSCCDGMMTDDQPAKAPSCCSVQAPTQPSVTSGMAVPHVMLPAVAILASAPAAVESDSPLAVSIADFSPPHCFTILRI